MTADDVKRALRGRHPGGYVGGVVGTWTCIEEFRGIDLLAWSAWASVGKYARVGYEVKVSRSDLRRELLRPAKRAANVAWCDEFYFAVPQRLLAEEELAFVEPEWEPGDFVRTPCPVSLGQVDAPEFRERPGVCRKGIRQHTLIGPVQWRTVGYQPDVGLPCDRCGGKGYAELSRVERDAPKCWIPRDVGLVVVTGNGTRVVRKSPRRKEVPTLGRSEIADLVRWISAHPDPRHHEHSATADGVGARGIQA